MSTSLHPVPDSLPATAAAPGLSSREAAIRLHRDGPNTLPQPERRGRLAIALRVLREPMLLLLIGAAAVYLLLGDLTEALLLCVSVVAVIGLTVYQEQKAEHALQALRDLGSPRAHVLRDGNPQRIAAHEVVVGDLLLVAEGDRLPADARVLESVDLHVDESLLSGESMPVARPAGAELLHASTMVVRGHGTAEVVATGPHTAVGQIGVALHGIRIEQTPLQRELRRIVTLFAWLAFASCLGVAALFLATRGGWLDALLAGITLAIANIPEEFPVILTVFLALGAWRMARHEALVRRAPVIEALGATTVLCTDKTGTLTENRMQVAELLAKGERASADGPHSPGTLDLLRVAALACPAISFDPMDRALQEAGRRANVATESAHPAHEYGFSPQCPLVAVAWPDGSEGLFVACKGAPEAIVELCDLAAEAGTGLLADVEAMASRGLRVLAVASAHWKRDVALPGDVRGFRFSWNGLVGFADPLREGVADAVEEARAAGVRVVMLTGDHMLTARAIATQAGIAHPETVVLGSELDGDRDTASQPNLHANVYARVKPEHKLRLVRALEDAGETVAMTGDGVNDAPALMAAHVGIAMGQRGTDVAREAAAIVLLDDNFITVVRAMRLGRVIYDNIRRAVRYILAVHVPITGLALLPLLTGGPLVLLPLHVVFLELIIDPACSFVFEREPAAADIMRRLPRSPARRMVDAAMLAGSLLHGAAMFAAVLAIYAFARWRSLPDAETGALAFTSLVAGNLGLILLYRQGDSLQETLRLRNPAFLIVALAALCLLATVTWVEVPSRWFGFAAPPLAPWLLALVLPLSLAASMKAFEAWIRPGAAMR